MEVSKSTALPPARVLCLHGKHQCGEILSQRIRPLAKRLGAAQQRKQSQRQRTPSAELFYPDAPFELPLEEGQTVPMRTWWRRGTVREDWQEALKSLRAFAVEYGPFDGVLGFSQGGAVAAELARLARVTRPAANSSQEVTATSDDMLLGQLKFVVVAGAPMRTGMPFVDDDWGISAETGLPQYTVVVRGIPSVHYAGERDTVVSPGESAALARCFADSLFVKHDAGHVFPSKTPLLGPIEALIEQARVERAHVAATAHSDLVNLQLQNWQKEKGKEKEGKTGPESSASSLETQNLSEEQEQELEALEAIYGDDFKRLALSPARFSVAVRDEESTSNDPVQLIFSLPVGYPELVPCGVRAHQVAAHLEQGRALEAILALKLTDALEQSAQEALGAEAIFPLVEMAKEWLAEMRAEIKSNAGAGTLDLHVDARVLEASGSSAVAKAPNHRGVDAAAAAAAPPATGSSSSAADPSGHGGLVMWQETDGEDFNHTALIKAATEAAASAARKLPNFYEPPRRGRSGAAPWSFTVGLVGKPSVGKSTLFNATVDPAAVEQTAAVAAHPFTTIDPNIGTGYFATQGPAASVGLAVDSEVASCGRAVDGRLLVPMVVKDVAGLVPGAYQGRGKGNVFLNDLNDADVLVHCIDGSGRSDASGVALAQGEGDAPEAEVAWVREEIHRWIYDNVRARWPSLCRRPERLSGMFTGYHCRPALAEEAMRRCGLQISGRRTAMAEALMTWGPAELHLLVAHFLRLRFPILLALNKADLPGAAEHVERVRKTWPHEPSVALSAATEWRLRQWRRAGVVAYVEGAAEVQFVEVGSGGKEVGNGGAAASKSKSHHPTAAERKEVLRVLSELGGTGVLDVFTRAVALKPPLVLFPVRDTESCRGVGADCAKTLATCVLMHPGSTPEDLYSALKGPPLYALAGDYVRAEARSTGGSTQPLKKEQPIPGTVQVICVQTNRKSVWQSSARPQLGAGVDSGHR